MIDGVPSHSLLGFALTSAIIEVTPGPNMAYLAALSLAQGRRAGFAAVAGIALGLSAYGIAVGFGLGTVISNSVLLYESLRWAGVLYLFWLAWDAWKAERDGAAAAAPPVSCRSHQPCTQHLIAWTDASRCRVIAHPRALARSCNVRFRLARCRIHLR